MTSTLTAKPSPTGIDRADSVHRRRRDDPAYQAF